MHPGGERRKLRGISNLEIGLRLMQGPDFYFLKRSYFSDKISILTLPEGPNRTRGR